MQRAKASGKKVVTHRMSKLQVKHNTKFEGGFLSMLLRLATKALPVLLGGIATDALSGAVEKVVSGNHHAVSQVYLFREFSSFIQKFYKVDEMIASTVIDPITYKALFPIIMFDVSRQSDRLKTGVTDITLKCTFSENVPASTMAHAVMISDRKLRFKTDGEKATVMF